MQYVPTIINARRTRYPVHHVILPFRLGLVRLLARAIRFGLGIVLCLCLLDGIRRFAPSVRSFPRIRQCVLFGGPFFEDMVYFCALMRRQAILDDRFVVFGCGRCIFVLKVYRVGSEDVWSGHDGGVSCAVSRCARRETAGTM